MADLVRRLRPAPGGSPLLFDGGIGTALVAHGLDLQVEPPERWLLSRPDAVQAVHEAFAEAGADVLQTNSFGLLRLMAAPGGRGGWPGEPPDWRQLARTSVALAQAAARRGREGVAVVASLGSGALRPGGGERLRALAGAVAAWFAEAGVAALHLETCYDPAELRQVLAGVRDGAPALPLLVSLTLNVGQSGLETPLGVPLGRMLQELEDEPPDAVGVNCSLHARRIRPAVAAMAEWAADHGGLPVLAQPQVDQPTPDCKRPAAPEPAERFARDLLALLDEGATALGGCCGCRPAHIAAVRRLLDGAPEAPAR